MLVPELFQRCFNLFLKVCHCFLARSYRCMKIVQSMFDFVKKSLTQRQYLRVLM
ncbi:hypothetical protein BCEN4_1090073 [Burkholderia cenocepacia]|nr:hypothetical protein BCEN4_1090073 [Burkholderia cenocepacia]